MGGTGGLGGLGGVSPPGGAVFDPRNIANLWLWLDAEQVPGADTDVITTWSDVSGNGRDFTQSTGANRPTLRTGVQNGRRVIRFDGTDYYISVDIQSLSHPSTAFFVGIRNGATTSFNVVFTQNPEVLAFGYSSVADDFYYYDGSAVDAFDGDDGAFHIHAYSFNGSSSFTRFDGAANVGSTLAETDAVDDTFAIGATTGGAADLNGDLAEVIVYEALLTAGQIALVEAYLSTKWGITLS